MVMCEEKRRVGERERYATLLFIGCKEKKILILWLCVKRKREWGKEREREEYFFLLLFY